MKTAPILKAIAALTFFTAFIMGVNAQTTQVAVIRQWVQHFAVQDSIMESPATRDGDGNYYIAGYTLGDSTGADIVVAKYQPDGTPTGQLVWSDQFFSDSCYCRDQATAIVVDENQNVYVTGITFNGDSSHGFDYVTIKYDASGNREWVRYYNGNYWGGYDIPVDICEDNGDVYVTGTSQDSVGLLDIVTINYKSDGTEEWVAQYDDSLYDVPRAMQVTSARVIITGASQNSLLDWDYLTLQYFLDGTPADSIIVTNTGNSFDRANAVALTDSGTAYITGRAYISATDYDIRTVKIDSLGNMLWVVDYDYNELMDEATSIAVDIDENIYVTGYGTADSANEDYITIKLDSSGDLQWVKYFNGLGNAKDVAWDIDVDSFGVAYVTGESDHGNNHNFCTIAYQTSDGLLLWKDIYDGPGHCWDKATNVECDSAGIVYVSGQACINDSTYEYVTIRYYSRHVLIPPDSVSCPSSFAFYGNFGQIIDTDDSVRMDIKHYTTNHYPSLYFFEPDSANDYTVLSYAFAHVDEDTATTDTLHRVDLTFESFDGEDFGAMVQKPHPFPVDKSDQGYLNYFLAHCPDGITGVEGYKRISYPDAFFLTDIQFYGNNSGMKFYIIAKPDAAEDILLKFTGQDSLIITDSTLTIVTSVGSYTYERPKVFQIDSLGNREEVSWAPEYVDLDSGRVGFVLQSYYTDMPLVIEVGQSLMSESSSVTGNNCVYSMYYGGTLHDKFWKVHSDASFKFYTAGETSSIDFPRLNALSFISFNASGNSEGVFVRFDSAAVREFATFIGGNATDKVHGIATDNLGNIYIVGTTGSTNFPIRNPGGGAYVDSTLNSGDGFICKLRPTSNQLIWSTYYGGIGSEGFYDIQKNLNEEFYAVGYGDSLCPVQFQSGDYIDSLNGSGLIVRFDSSGVRKWATLFGSRGGLINRAAVESALYYELFITGWADSINFPIANPGGGAYVDSTFNGGFSDAFIARFDSSNSLVWSTYIGGSGRDFGNDIAITPYNPGAYVCIGGSTQSNNFPYNYSPGNYVDSTLGATITGFDGDGFIAKFTYNGVRDWATYIGGSSDDGILAIAVDEFNNTYVSGQINSTDLTTQDSTNVFYRNYSAGTTETFVAAFRPINTYFWGTYFGGQRTDVTRSLYIEHATGRLFMAGETGSPRSGVPSAQKYPWVFLPTPSWFQNEVNLGYQDACIAWFDVGTIGAFLYPSVPEIAGKECEISIFPNPAENHLYLLLGNDFHSKATVKIYNSLMQIIYDRETDNIMETLNVQNLSDGIYFVHVTTTKCTAIRKIIIQR